MKIRWLFSLLSLSFISLIGCNSTSNRYQIDYGTYLNTEATEINYDDLKTRLDSNETFLLSLYNEESCSCWNRMHLIINNYVKDYHIPIYYMCMDEIAKQENHFSLSLADASLGSKVSINVMSKGKVVTYMMTSNKEDYNRRFDDYATFKKEINKIIKAPSIYYIDEEMLEAKINNKENVVVSFIRNSCSDCSYIMPNVVIPFSKNNNLKRDIYLIDMQDFYDANKDTPTYQAYKDKWQLSEEGNATFGYGKGVVPTTQYYENGELKDACVSFNDTISKVGDQYIVSESYYSAERINNLSYLKDVKNKILKGLTLDETDCDIIPYNEDVYIGWSHESANKYHKPILEAFLKTYTK